MNRYHAILLAFYLVLRPQESLSPQQTISDTPKAPVKLQFFDNRGCEPGEVSIRFHSKTTDNEKLCLMKGLGLSGGAMGTGHEIIGPTPSEVVIKVPEGTEEFWVHLLKQLPLVKDANFVPYTTASTDYYIIQDLNKHLPFSDASAKVLRNASSLHDVLLNLLKEKFPSKSNFTLVKSRDNLLQIQVSGLRGEMIEGSNDWEKIDPLTLVFFIAGNKLNIFAILDASYAKTISSHAPPDTAYRPIGPEHYKEMETFLTALTTHLLTQLRTMGVLQ